jgi:hypothetical protein
MSSVAWLAEPPCKAIEPVLMSPLAVTVVEAFRSPLPMSTAPELVSAPAILSLLPPLVSITYLSGAS